ncbi:MAG: class I adenylate-forming enzyme family protein, partial [Clostridiales bacterium]
YVTGFPIIPTVAALILKLHGLEKLSLSPLRYITNAGAALPVEHVKRLRALLPHVKIYSMYGCAECLRVSYLSPDEIDDRPSSVGKAIPNCEVFILDENGVPVKQGETGELVVRGSHVMRGYWKSPELTEKVFGSGIMQGEILLHTGDYFKQDSEGYLYFVCRKDDMIKTSGKKVSPKEVENVLYCINGVIEASVIGVQDEILGQAVKAFIVLMDGTDLRKNDILKYCSERLEKHMVPKYIEIIDRLPKTLNGKIDKLTLKQHV